MILTSDTCTALEGLLNSTFGAKSFEVFMAPRAEGERLFGFPRSVDTRMIISTTAGPVDQFRTYIEAALSRVLSLRAWSAPRYEGYILEAQDGTSRAQLLGRFSDKKENGLEVVVLSEQQNPYFRYEFDYDENRALRRKAMRLGDGATSVQTFSLLNTDNLALHLPTKVDPEWKEKRAREKAIAASIFDGVDNLNKSGA